MNKQPLPIHPAKRPMKLTGYERRLQREKRLNRFFIFLFALLFMAVAAAVVGRVFPTCYEAAIILGLITGIVAGMSAFNMIKYFNHE